MLTRNGLFFSTSFFFSLFFFSQPFHFVIASSDFLCTGRDYGIICLCIIFVSAGGGMDTNGMDRYGYGKRLTK